MVRKISLMVFSTCGCLMQEKSKGQYEKTLCGTTSKKDFFVSENNKNENKLEKVETWYGAMNWLHIVVVKTWNGLEIVAM